MKTIKEMLQDIMTAKGYDCQRLAKALEVDKSQVSRWLSGSIPKPCNLRRIEKLYKEINDEENKCIDKQKPF